MRIAWALLAAIVFGGTLTVALLSGPRDIIDVPTVAPEPGWRESVVQLRRRPQLEDVTQWTLQLSTNDPAALLEREAIALMVGTNGERIKMHAATLGIAGTECEYVADMRTLSDHALLELMRQAARSQVSLEGSGVTLNLAIHTAGGSLVLAFDVPPRGAIDPAPLYVGLPQEPKRIARIKAVSRETGYGRSLIGRRSPSPTATPAKAARILRLPEVHVGRPLAMFDAVTPT